MKRALIVTRIARPDVSVTKLLACIILFCAAAVSACAQSDGVSVGGKWMEYTSEDKMTLAKKVRFELEADNFLRDSSYHKPKIEILCTNGKLEYSFFNPNVRLGPPSHPSFWGMPQAEVLVRVDDSHDTHGWNWVRGSSLSMDKGTTRKLLRAQVFKVEFRTAAGTDIAEFSPGDIDTGRVAKACGFNPK